MEAIWRGLGQLSKIRLVRVWRGRVGGQRSRGEGGEKGARGGG